MYNNAKQVPYSYNGINQGAATVTRVIRGPKGKRGRLVDIISTPTTAFVGTTTPGKVQIGDGVTANKYADLFMGTAGTPAPVSVPVLASDVTLIGSGAAIKGQDPTSLPFTYLPADTALTVTFLQPVGTPAGVADHVILIDWDV
jgi:hypothetical protein